MARSKVLATFVHVQGDDGESVALPPGLKVPAKYADQVTNPACYVVVESESESESDTPPPAQPENPPAPPATQPPAPAVVQEKPIGEQSFPELQATAKSRGLSGAGNTETLIARLEADNRDKALEAAEAAATATATGTTTD